MATGSLRTLIAHRMSLRLLPSLRMGPLYGRRHCVHSCTSVAASAVAAAKPQPPAVDPPPLVGFSPDTINSVVVSGLALSEPRVHYLAANQVAAHFSLGLRPCNFRLDLPQQPQGAVFVDSWGLLALQLQQHVHKGDRVQVRGVLREDTWTDNATGKPRRAVKIIAEELALVAPPTDQHVEGLPPQHQEQEQEEADGEEPHFPPAQAQALQRPRMSLSAEQSLHMYQQMGLGLEAIAAARGIKMSTVIEHLLAAAEVGAFPTACWQRLASDVCLGASDAWLSPAEVAEAVMAVEQENPGVELRAIPLRAIRQRLAEGEGTSAKVAELQSSRGGDPSLVYGAIRVVITMLKQGVSFATINSSSSASHPTRQPPF